MNTTNAAVLAGALTVLGRWSEGDDMDVRIVVGVITLAVMLAALPDKVARPFAYLVLAAVLFRYGKGIVDASGITEPRRQRVVPGQVIRPERTARV